MHLEENLEAVMVSEVVSVGHVEEEEVIHVSAKELKEALKL